MGVGSGFDALYLCYRLHKPCKVSIIDERHKATTNAALLAGHIKVDIKPANLVVFVEPESGYGFLDVDCYYSGTIIDACQALHLYPKEIIAPTCFSFHPLKPLHCYGDGGCYSY